MTIGEFVDAMNAELLRGREFGTKKQQPLEKKSIRRYDEDQGAGSNGMLRWKNDRGYLFAIPVDMERTQPGGRVVLSRDDANITDWIQNSLNGYTLRLSKSGNIYVEGQNGLPKELAEIFGRYPTIGTTGSTARSSARQAVRSTPSRLTVSSRCSHLIARTTTPGARDEMPRRTTTGSRPSVMPPKRSSAGRTAA